MPVKGAKFKKAVSRVPLENSLFLLCSKYTVPTDFLLFPTVRPKILWKFKFLFTVQLQNPVIFLPPETQKKGPMSKLIFSFSRGQKHRTRDIYKLRYTNALVVPLHA